MLNYLSIDLGVDLKDILQQASQKGFMIDIAGSTMFRFAHDKIQEAVYEMIPEQQRRENHMRFGLALCTQTLDNSVEDEELFYAAVNQINQGGPTAVHEPSQKSVFAQLNLKAGRRSIDFDYNTAFTMFQYGLSFLGEDSWSSNYALSLDLHDSLTEVAMILNKPTVVEFYSGKVISNAICFDDKLNCKIFCQFHHVLFFNLIHSTREIKML
jgi:predicted ATPase